MGDRKGIYTSLSTSIFICILLPTKRHIKDDPVWRVFGRIHHTGKSHRLGGARRRIFA
nr:MAG TPA: hypothetical protein [Caudoviricetes sp.]